MPPLHAATRYAGIPTGFRLQSRGLPRRGYPGSSFESRANRNAVAPSSCAAMGPIFAKTPLGFSINDHANPKVVADAPTLGWQAIPLGLWVVGATPTFNRTPVALR